ncbi:DeoR/GlpR family DNA-binding transcription regulator [Paenibacillus sp. NPDC056579]|uniref:DeoR/GlpR family DNA-binding transcription regulator n=1 Tax=unclassified Paenibacillus TaxID=185978 RepID=UPI001EF8289F|nr:DeoR/GlpR family DNA-binding transcription regulator [Paenibacillus sp. H1-7]ULL14053.1 DeoR/GlpR transcriptional regulator [Paenibacillus sp. H1-7]
MSLVGEERKDYILNLLNLEGKVKTGDLVERLKVSSETIRRYLEELEEENKLKRVYGGAIKYNLDREEASHFKREVTRAEEKRRIGRAAATLVEDNDVVFIDDGTTTLQMIPYLQNKKNLTVMTISIAALSALIEYKNKELFSGEIYFIGGKVDTVHFRTTGSIAEKMAASFYADKTFITIDGIMMGKGITGFDAERGQLAQKLMEQSKQTIVLTDHSKFGNVQFYKLADLREIDIIISDVKAPKEWESYLADKDVVWIHAE